MSLNSVAFQNYFLFHFPTKNTKLTFYTVSEISGEIEVILSNVVNELKKLKILPNEKIQKILSLNKKKEDSVVACEELKIKFKDAAGFLVSNSKGEVILSATNSETIKESGIEQYFIELVLEDSNDTK